MSGCGYLGHVCSSRDVQFISRYRDQNDYCVAGHRIGVSDEGQVRGNPTPDELKAILLFELERYADYLDERVRRCWRWGPNHPDRPELLPFDPGIARAVEP